MKLNEILDKLDEYNDIYEDLYNRELHDLSDEDSEKLTVKEFLLLLLDENSDDS
jgi:recombinational DNA repair protein (RecF pathway)